MCLAGEEQLPFSCPRLGPAVRWDDARRARRRRTVLHPREDEDNSRGDVAARGLARSDDHDEERDDDVEPQGGKGVEPAVGVRQQARTGLSQLAQGMHGGLPDHGEIHGGEHALEAAPRPEPSDADDQRSEPDRECVCGRLFSEDVERDRCDEHEH